MTAQLRLLELQAVDSALARLVHRRRTLPEQAALDALVTQQTTAASELVGAQTRVSDLELEQERAEADLEPVRQRLTRNQARMDAGTVDAKALGAMVEEVAHLRRRIGDLEDVELDVMQRLEDATAAQDAVQVRVDALVNQIGDATAARDTAAQQLANEAAYQRTERDRFLPDIPDDLLALYTKIGTSHNGVGAAELLHRRCTGCQLEVNASELRDYRAAAPEEVLRCEECGRILVRTAESGL